MGLFMGELGKVGGIDGGRFLGLIFLLLVVLLVLVGWSLVG